MLRIGLRICLIVAALLLVSAGSFFAYYAYCKWRADEAVGRAKASLGKKNLQDGILSLRAALRHRPDHVEAHRTIASLLEASRSSEALVHRQRLTDLQPQLLEPKLSYARSALLFDRPQEAAMVLEGIKGSRRKTSAFMEVRAELFLARARTDLALEIYRELLERHPEDRRLRAKVTALELQSGSEQDRDAARAALEALAPDEELGLMALRALTQDALRRQDFSAALSWSGRASEMPSAAFSDRVMRLQALFGAKSPAYNSWLSDLEKDAFENPHLALELGKWKVIAMGPQMASVWLESAPKGVQDDPAISGLLAECYSALDRWEDLESLTSLRSWRELDALRFALMARAQAGQGNFGKSEQTWKLAVAAAEEQPDQLVRLLTIARADKRDVRQLLWVIAEKDPRHVSARRELYQAYWLERNADGMLRMMELVLKENPDDRAAKYNVASLLMATGRQIERAGRLAKELYENDPQALGNAALYAFGLHLQGDTEKGADLLDSREDLEQLGSDGAAYCALVFSACGKDDKARQLLAAVDREILLPELRASLDRVFGTAAKSASTVPAQ
jgi:tetratricopeptide (TPR) repeat protein